MKGILCYFSGTGNTKWAADRFKERFNFYGVELELLNIEKNSTFDIDNYEFFIVGTPIYAESGPKIVDDFIKRFPENKKKEKMRCMLYSTQGAAAAAAVVIYRKLLEAKGYNVMVQTMIQMPNNYYFAFGKKPSEETKIKILDDAKQKIRKLTEDFIQDKKVIESVSGARVLVGKLVVKSYWRFLPSMSRHLKSTDECTKCGVCLKNCPNSNITFEDGHAIFHSNCMMCLRCIHQCPINAIRYKGKKIEQTQKDIIKNLDIR